MHLPDLVPFPTTRYAATCNVLAVGWLDPSLPIATGVCPDSFKANLSVLCNVPIHLSRGFYRCPFCAHDPARGNGEVHVRGQEAVVYVAPSLIGHYVEKHGYHPPREFIDAVIACPVREGRARISDLASRVIALAAEPSAENREAFYRLVQHSKLGLRVPPEVGNLRSGVSVTTRDGELEIPVATSPEGDPMFVMLADVARLAELEPAARFADLNPVDVLRLAERADAGVIVQALGPKGYCWAGIPKSEVKAMVQYLGVVTEHKECHAPMR